MNIQRNLQAYISKSKKSVLLLGPRQTGKSTLIKQCQPELFLNLSDESTYLNFLRNPQELVERLAAKTYKSICVDEIQRLPSLLNTIQHILDNSPPIKFYLTGSSARKLKRGQANLLPGRLHTYELGPLTVLEIGQNFKLEQALSTGTLPGIYLESSNEERIKTLRSYSTTYLKEEIQAEALTRNLQGFARFIYVAAAVAGRSLDLTKLASEAQIPRQTAGRYFEILEDTLIVNVCHAFAKSERRRLIQHPKFYFFDNGVYNALLENFKLSTDRKGLLFEQFFFNQLIAITKSKDKTIRISNYKTESGAEVDFIVEQDDKLWAIEVKASTNVGTSDLRGLKSFAEFIKKPHASIVVYLGEHLKKIETTTIYPWKLFLEQWL